MSNPLINGGSLNRLLASLSVPTFSSLNVTSSYLTKAGISIALQGGTSEQFEALTSVTQIPNPYVQVDIAVHLLRSQTLAQNWRAQLEANSLIGEVYVYPDVQGTGLLSKYSFYNCSIQTIEDISFGTADPSYVVHIRGTYVVNNNLWT